MSHLRQHPLYDPLPHPKEITKLPNLEYVSQFRQDSWQWDALHSGRCTTSQVAPALGFLEPKAASDLGIPKSLQKSCMGDVYTQHVHIQFHQSFRYVPSNEMG